MLKKVHLALKFVGMYWISHSYLLIGKYYFDKAKAYLEDEPRKWAKYIKKALDWNLKCATVQTKMNVIRKELEDLIPELKEF